MVRESKAGLKVIAAYNSDISEVGTAERMLGEYGRLLESVVASPLEKI